MLTAALLEERILILFSNSIRQALDHNQKANIKSIPISKQGYIN